MIQLNPHIPFYVPELDMEGWAFLVNDLGAESYIYFTLIMDNGEVWTFPNTRIRGCYNRSLDRFPKDKNKDKNENN